MSSSPLPASAAGLSSNSTVLCSTAAVPHPLHSLHTLLGLLSGGHTRRGAGLDGPGELSALSLASTLGLSCSLAGGAGGGAHPAAFGLSAPAGAVDPAGVLAALADLEHTHTLMLAGAHKELAAAVHHALAHAPAHTRGALLQSLSNAGEHLLALQRSFTRGVHALRAHLAAGGLGGGPGLPYFVGGGASLDAPADAWALAAHPLHAAPTRGAAFGPGAGSLAPAPGRLSGLFDHETDAGLDHPPHHRPMGLDPARALDPHTTSLLARLLQHVAHDPALHAHHSAAIAAHLARHGFTPNAPAHNPDAHPHPSNGAPHALNGRDHDLAPADPYANGHALDARAAGGTVVGGGVPGGRTPAVHDDSLRAGGPGGPAADPAHQPAARRSGTPGVPGPGALALAGGAEGPHAAAPAAVVNAHPHPVGAAAHHPDAVH